MLNYYHNSNIYTALELQRQAISPINYTAHLLQDFYQSPMNPIAYTPVGRFIGAGFQMIERMTRHYLKPEFGIKETQIDGKNVRIDQHVTSQKDFCNLVHFRKPPRFKQPKMLIVAPMSGHYATLLRGTVEGLLPHFDIYITDWVNACDVPLSRGKFDLDDYVDYVIEFIGDVGKDVHIVGVCQPAVPVLSAVSLMSSEGAKCLPKSMILMGGPIDTRNSPTEVNELAKSRPIEWFTQTVISRVPMNYPGFGRPVYPGFMQLTGFMTMNLDRHIEAHHDLFSHLVEGDGDSVDAHKKFYNEYLSVMDITAEFYLQTVKTVFQEHALPKGKMMVRDKPVRPQDIKHTALLTIEGERDDISGRNQTKAAHNLCKGISEEHKRHHLQKSVGHYGIFNGRCFRENIVPVICEFTSGLS